MTRTKEVLIQLDLQKKKHEGKLIAIVERKNSNGNFVLSTIIDYNLKNNHGVCFVSLYNPVSHYQHVGVKLGCNLKAGIDKGQVEFIEMLSTTRETLLQEDSTMVVGKTIVLSLLEKIKTSLGRLVQQYGTSYVFVDDMSILLSLGVSLKDVRAFLHYLQVLVSTESSKRYFNNIHNCIAGVYF